MRWSVPVPRCTAPSVFRSIDHGGVPVGHDSLPGSLCRWGLRRSRLQGLNRRAPNLGGGCGFPLGLEEREPNGKAQYGEAGTDGQPRKH